MKLYCKECKKEAKVLYDWRCEDCTYGTHEIT